MAGSVEEVAPAGGDEGVVIDLSGRLVVGADLVHVGQRGIEVSQRTGVARLVADLGAEAQACPALWRDQIQRRRAGDIRAGPRCRRAPRERRVVQDRSRPRPERAASGVREPSAESVRRDRIRAIESGDAFGEEPHVSGVDAARPSIRHDRLASGARGRAQQQETERSHHSRRARPPLAPAVVCGVEKKTRRTPVSAHASRRPARGTPART